PVAGGPAGKPPGLFERGGIRLYARGVGTSDERSLDFVPGAGNLLGMATMHLEIGCALGDGDAERIAGGRNGIARDDQGDLLTANPGPLGSGGDAVGQYPDEWRVSINFPAPHPSATKLQSVEGDLMAYRFLRPLRVEVPLPLAEKRVRREAGDLTLIISHYRLVPRPEAHPPDPGDDPPDPHLGRAWGPLRASVRGPALLPGAGASGRSGRSREPSCSGGPARPLVSGRTQWVSRAGRTPGCRWAGPGAAMGASPSRRMPGCSRWRKLRSNWPGSWWRGRIPRSCS